MTRPTTPNPDFVQHAFRRRNAAFRTAPRHPLSPSVRAWHACPSERPARRHCLAPCVTSGPPNFRIMYKVKYLLTSIHILKFVLHYQQGHQNTLPHALLGGRT